MNRRPFALLCFAALLCFVLLGCVSRNHPSSYDVYLRVHPAKGQASAYVLEQSQVGETFTEGAVALHGAPHENMAPHLVGALPVATGVFRMWEGDDPQNPLPRLRGTEISAAGGPWRGVVAELQRGVRYPATQFTPVPGQPARRGRPLVSTEVFYCDTANILACVPWDSAIALGWVTCETQRRKPLPASACGGYVPYTEWYVRASADTKHERRMARGARGRASRPGHAGTLPLHLRI